MSVSAIIRINGTVANHCVMSWDISNKGGWCWECRLSMSGFEFWAACDPTVNQYNFKISVTVNIDGASQEYLFLAEERSESITAPGIEWEVWGRSKQALLGEKFSPVISDTAATEYNIAAGTGHVWQNRKSRAAEIISYLLAEYAPAGSPAVNWNIPDFPVWPGTMEVQSQYPIDVILRLAEAVGAEVIAGPDGNLTIAEYNVTGDSPVASFSDADHIVSLSSMIESTARLNVVTVCGENDVVADDDPENDDGGDVPGGGNPDIRVETAPEQEGIDTHPDEWHYARIYFWHHESTSPIIYIYSDASGFQHEFSAAVVESITETVALTWGEGRAGYRNLDGETHVAVPEDADIPYSTAPITYSTRYYPIKFRGDAVGDVRVAVYYPDGTADDEYDFEIVRLCSDAQCCEEEGGRWIDGECVFDDPDPEQQITAWMQAENITGPVEEGLNYCRIRVWFYHSDPAVFENALAKMEDYYPGLTHKIGLWNPQIYYNYSETVQLKWGKGSTSKPDTTGNQAVDVSADYTKPFSQTTVMYDVYYRDFDLYSYTAGEYPCAFWFEDGSAESSASVTVIDPVPAAVFRPTTLEIYNEQTDAIVVGAAVYVDGVYLGITDSNGRIMTGSLEVGTTHTLRVTAAGYIDSDIDDIANDTFVAQ